jgi:microcystin degradation protein MlrC
MHAVEALVSAGARGCVVGVLHAPDVAAAAHHAGVGATLNVTFNQGIDDPFSKSYAARVTVRAIADGRFNARSGVGKGFPLDQGKTAALAIGDLIVVVGSRCLQTFAAEQLEMVGIDLHAVRAVVVKSRGHYQASFSEFFTRERMIELDLPGWQTPRLERLPYQHIPRPLYPLDPQTQWLPALTYRKQGA